MWLILGGSTEKDYYICRGSQPKPELFWLWTWGVRPRSKHLTTLHLHLFTWWFPSIMSFVEPTGCFSQVPSQLGKIWNMDRGSWHLFCIHVPCLQREAPKKRGEGYAEPQVCQVQLSKRKNGVCWQACSPGNYRNNKQRTASGIIMMMTTKCVIHRLKRYSFMMMLTYEWWIGKHPFRDYIHLIPLPKKQCLFPYIPSGKLT